MKQSRKPNAPEDDKSNAPWSEMQALELWKHFGSVGTQDKNTMVTVESLLLGFSAAIIGYYVGTNLLTFQPLHVEDPVKGIYIALLGVGISYVAGYVSLLYGGYATWNWAQAGEIARKLAKDYPKWSQLLPENSEAALQKWTSGKRSFYAIAMRLGQPGDPQKQLAPIFPLYTRLALFSALAHLVVFLLSLWSL